MLHSTQREPERDTAHNLHGARGVSEGLFREKAVVAISDGTGTEFHLSPPALINRAIIATLVIFATSVTFIGNAVYARSQVVYGKFDEHHLARITANALADRTFHL